MLSEEMGQRRESKWMRFQVSTPDIQRTSETVGPSSFHRTLNGGDSGYPSEKRVTWMTQSPENVKEPQEMRTGVPCCLVV